MNFKNMTYREITQLLSGHITQKDMEEAITQLDTLIDSLKILKRMLEGRKVFQGQVEKKKQRERLKIVHKKYQDSNS